LEEASWIGMIRKHTIAYNLKSELD